MTSRVEALVKPELLVWARKNAGLSLAESAKKAQVKADRLKSWEDGLSRPSVKQLRRLAATYKRPLGVFYLPEAPVVFDVLHDYRRLPDSLMAHESPRLKLEIRGAQYRRQVAVDLYEMMGEPIPELHVTVDTSQNPEDVAGQLRKLIGITIEDQINWRSPYRALGHWRAALETLGLLVFQVSGVEASEMRGFSLGETPLPVLGVNVKDAPLGRIFSMIHELVHVILQKGGLCDFEEERSPSSEERETEVLCNRLAGAILLPMEELLAEQIVKIRRYNNVFHNAEILSLANRYSVSREVVLRRLLIAGRINQDFYRMKRKEFQNELALNRNSRRRTGYALPHIKTISRCGPTFVRLVLNAYSQEIITASDLSDFLEVRLKHIPKIKKTLNLETVASESIW